jgi:phosphoribosylformylglycinamidine (FGAM) synthase PurS component
LFSFKNIQKCQKTSCFFFFFERKKERKKKAVLKKACDKKLFIESTEIK